MRSRKSAPLIQYSTQPYGEDRDKTFVRSRLSQITLWSAFWSLLLLGSIAFGSVTLLGDKFRSVGETGSTTAVGTTETSSPAENKLREPQAKISRFCIFGVDDLKLRPSAARGKNQPRRVTASENGDCWIDKPGQMA